MHGLSIIENPKRGKKNYNKWLGDQAKPSHRDILRSVIDDALAKTPVDFEAFLKLLLDNGYEMKRGKNFALRGQDQKRFIRLDSLGEEYSENMTKGGPVYRTTTIVLYLFDKFQDLRLGYASAIAYVLFFILVILSFIQWRLPGSKSTEA